jgi:hypothetical protein
MDLVTIAALISFALLVVAWLGLPASPDATVDPLDSMITRPQFRQVEVAGEERAS